MKHRCSLHCSLHTLPGVQPWESLLGPGLLSSPTLVYNIGHREWKRGGKSGAVWEREGRKARQFLRLLLAAKFQINPVFLLCPAFSLLMQMESLTPLHWWWGVSSLLCGPDSCLLHPTSNPPVFSKPLPTAASSSSARAHTSRS